MARNFHIALLFLLWGFAPAISQAAIIYRYEGLNFNYAYNQYDTTYTMQDKVSVTIELLNPLTINLTEFTVNPLSLVMSDGKQVLDAAATGFQGNFRFSTDANGNITKWLGVVTNVRSVVSGDVLREIITGERLDILSGRLERYDYGRQAVCTAQSFCFPFARYSQGGRDDGRFGVWTTVQSSVPEPQIWLLLTTGFGMLGLLIRRHSVITGVALV
jgi:hypothetical protein